jgi:hypothetical protein
MEIRPETKLDYERWLINCPLKVTVLYSIKDLLGTGIG